MRDPFGREITYVRVSVTDRCDFRCVYCMAEEMTFLPKAELLTLEELDRLYGTFVDLGVRKIRLTGGEPLVRRNIMWLVGQLGRHLRTGALDELTVTTNGSQLERHAEALARAGVRRINVSFDTLDPDPGTRVERVERDVDPAHARPRQRLGVALELAAVGRDRQLLEGTGAQVPAELLDQPHDVAPDQGLAASQPDLRTPRSTKVPHSRSSSSASAARPSAGRSSPRPCSRRSGSRSGR